MKPANRKKQLPSAFTLIELLVVVATIALLLAILLPGLRGARQFARGVACQTNLNQIGKAWQMYLNVYDGAFYQGGNASMDYGGWSGDVGWYPRPLNPFVSLPVELGANLVPPPDTHLDMNAPETVQVMEQAKIFRCPCDNGGVPNSALLCFQRAGTSYITNAFLIGQNKILTGTGPLVPLNVEINKRLRRMNVSKTTDPSHLVLIGDYGWYNQWQPKIKAKTEWHNRPAYHNVAFLDGHVDMVHIRKGLFVTPSYRVLPFEDLDALALSLQQEEP